VIKVLLESSKRCSDIFKIKRRNKIIIYFGH